MMDLSQIRDLSAEQARKAAKAKKHPFTVEQTDLDGYKSLIANGKYPHFPFPNIGDYRPKGWKLEDDTLFVDKTGLDKTGPALSISGLVNALQVGKGYAIIEEGEFQVVLGVFHNTGK